MVKSTRYIIILHKFTINDNHMIYGSWDINCNRQIFFLSSWAIFCPFTALIAQKMIISKKWKAPEISSFYTSVPKLMPYCSWDMVCRQRNCYFSFWATFCPFTPLPPPPLNCLKHENFNKTKKSTRAYHHFTQVYQKSWSYALLFLRYGTWHM